MKVAIIGAGAAGFFAAIAVKENYPKAKVIVFEKSKNILSKVRISGGGRCNVTNAETSISALAKCYPRGGRKLKKAFKEFNTLDTKKWFESRGVPLKAEADGRVFPVSDSSQSIVDCLLKEVEEKGIQIKTLVGVEEIIPQENCLQLQFRKTKDGQYPATLFDKVIVAAGGSPKRSGLDWLAALGHKIETPVPSLFTFNMPQESIKSLMGVVAEDAQVTVQGTKLIANGPLLITHWGMSGPSILKLSAFGARTLSDLNYEFKAQINWANIPRFEEVQAQLKSLSLENPKKALSNKRPFNLPKRLWNFLFQKAGFSDEKPWGELGKKGINKLSTIIHNDIYSVRGKTTFKEEFVTCGGISLESVDFKSMKSRSCPHLYFAGEILDIDGITGGFNFQAAWTTAHIAGKLRD